MSEVVLLQLIGLGVIGTGIVILLFIKAAFVRVIGFVAIVLGLFSLTALAAWLSTFKNTSVNTPKPSRRSSATTM